MNSTSLTSKNIIIQNPVIMYHDITDNQSNSGFMNPGASIYKIPKSTFELQIKTIANESQCISGKIVITFDDGGISAIDPAIRILNKYNFRGYFFVIGDKIGEKGFLNSNDIKFLASEGHIIGNHSFSHPNNFGRLNSDKQIEEWTKTNEILENILGEKITNASVPGGYYNKSVAINASFCGIEYLYTSNIISYKKVNECHVLGRLAVKSDTKVDEIIKFINRDYLFLLKKGMLNFAKKSFRIITGENYIKFRNWYLR